ncbi:MAG: hypothetical protein ABWY25_10825, partial [Paenisporosarcina sp.]
MRVTSVALYSSQFTEPIIFSLGETDPTPQYMVRTIIGLDAEEIIPKFYGFSSYSRQKYYDFGLKERDIVIRVVLKPRFNLDESYSDIRDEIYRTISSNRTGIIMLHFNSGATTVARIPGFITKLEVPYFSKTPELQMTIRCDDPMFRALNPVTHSAEYFGGYNPMVIIYDSLSTAPHGFTMNMTFNDTTPYFTVQDEISPTNEWRFRVIPSGGFLLDDILYF